MLDLRSASTAVVSYFLEIDPLAKKLVRLRFKSLLQKIQF